MQNEINLNPRVVRSSKSSKNRINYNLKTMISFILKGNLELNLEKIKSNLIKNNLHDF